MSMQIIWFVQKPHKELRMPIAAFDTREQAEAFIERHNERAKRLHKGRLDPDPYPLALNPEDMQEARDLSE